MSDYNKKLIEESLPVRTIGIECEREGKGIFPPLNRYHVWWARRPLIASRTAVLASLIDSDQMSMDELVNRMGITGDTVEKFKTVDERPSSQLVYEHYGYRRPFQQNVADDDLAAIREAARESWDGKLPTVLDPTAGGGSIPFESRRYRFPTVANELNSVASVLLKGVLEQPTVGEEIINDFLHYGDKIFSESKSELDQYFSEAHGHETPVSYLWANTVDCPDCGFEVALAPNWWIDRESSKEGVAVRPRVVDNRLEFSVVELTPDEQKAKSQEHIVTKSEFNPTNGTVSYGKGECPNCGVTIEGDSIKEQAQNSGFGEQIYCIEYRNLQTGNRGVFRAPDEEDKDLLSDAKEAVNSDPELATFLSESVPDGTKTSEARRYGITEWRDAFNARQLLTHHTLYKKFEEYKDEILDEYDQLEAETILTLLSVTADKYIDYNSRYSFWDPYTPKVTHAFDRHDFSFKWSFAETDGTADSAGYKWCLDYVSEVFEELVEDFKHVKPDDPLTVLNQDARNLELDDSSVEAVVVDPPYYDNVMYAELSDYFYVWMKKYLEDVYPGLFTTQLSNKDDEAVANPAQFDDVASEDNSKRELAKNDYENKMAGIFDEANRVLTSDGILSLMFTHKETEAWDTLTKSLVRAGFVINASHPISTENPRSLHQSGKNAARSTIFLAARKRLDDQKEPVLWEDVRDETRRAAHSRAENLDAREIEFSKVDMILSAFGPTLEIYTKNYPVVDSEGDEIQPQTALDEARTAVREYLIENYLNSEVKDVDNKTEWYIMSWLVFEAQRFPYDEARRLAIGLGENLDELKKTHRMWRKKGGDVLLRPHGDRVQDINKKEENRSGRKPVNPDSISFSLALDKVHAAMHIYESKGEAETWNWMNERHCGSDPAFKATVEALLRVLPNNHDDWELARDLSVGETGDLLDLDLDSSIFVSEDDDTNQGSITDF